MPSVYDVYFGWRKVVSVAITILTGAESGTTSSDCSGMNSGIASFANRQQQPTTEKEDSVPLTGRDKADLRDIALGDYFFAYTVILGWGASTITSSGISSMDILTIIRKCFCHATISALFVQVLTKKSYQSFTRRLFAF